MAPTKNIKMRRRELLTRTLLGGLGTAAITGCRMPLWVSPRTEACLMDVPSDMIRDAVIDPSGHHVLGVMGRSKLRVLNLDRRQARTLLVPRAHISSVGLAAGATWGIAVDECSLDGVWMCDFAVGRVTQLRHPRERLSHFAASRDGLRIVATGSRGRVYVWQRGRQRVWHSGKLDAALHSIAISDVDGSAWVGYTRDGVGGVARWAGARGLQIMFEGLPGTPTAVAAGAQGVFVTVAHDDGVSLYGPDQAQGMQPIVKRLPVRATSMNLSAEGTIAVGGGTVCADGGAALVIEGEATRLRAGNPQNWVDDVVLRGDGVAVTAGDTVELWADGKSVRLDYDGVVIEPAEPQLILCG